MNPTSGGIIEVIKNLATPEWFAKACEVCAGSGWQFGQRSNDAHHLPFWLMDLNGNPVFDAIWEAARPHCEQLAGRRLRVLRQYANGHTYGLGGQPHIDDNRPGTYTLLYYPMPEWLPSWQGETVFHEGGGEITKTVTPQPNQAVFFDSRIPHAGRAPSRACPALRVTVAFKLIAEETPENPAAPAHLPEPAEARAGSSQDYSITDLERQGSRRVCRIEINASSLEAAIEQRLVQLGASLRLPGFRPGKIPLTELAKRYGAQARREALTQLREAAIQRVLIQGGLPASLPLPAEAPEEERSFVLVVTHLPDLAEPDWEKLSVDRLVIEESITRSLEIPLEKLKELQNLHFRQQILDILDAHYQFPIAEPLIEKELKVLQRDLNSVPGEELPPPDELRAELLPIAERRVRLGAVLLEFARRTHAPAAAQSTALENHALHAIASRLQINDRTASLEEWRDLAGLD